jgi:hypothetical protein
MPTRVDDSRRYMVALLPIDAVHDVTLRLASLEEAVAYLTGFNEYMNETKTCAVILPDTLPDPPLFGRLFEQPGRFSQPPPGDESSADEDDDDDEG